MYLVDLHGIKIKICNYFEKNCDFKKLKKIILDFNTAGYKIFMEFAQS